MDIHETIKQALRHYQTGNLREAAHLFRTVLEAQPGSPEVLHLLGIIHAQLENYDPAISHLKRTLQLNPADAEAHLALGLALQQEGLADEAIGHFQRSISLDPGNSGAYNSLGNALKEKGLINDAADAYRKAVEIDPGSAEAYTNLGNILREKGQNDEAIACFNNSIRSDPDYVRAYYGLAVAIIGKWRLDEAVNVCNKILQINETDVFAYYVLGNIFMSRGKLDKAETYFRRAIEIKPDELKPHQALLVLTSYSPKYNAQSILSEHLQFAALFEKPLRSEIAPHKNDRSPDRRLKIGYVSPDFKGHSVAYFIEPVLAAHNRDLFEIFCYSDVSAPDNVTNRMKKYADHWKDITGVPDEKAAELIHKEEIDILIDLAGHTGGVNRILLFARKPSPVQVSWIGYLTTTGLSSIDYRIADVFSDPPGMTEQFYTEKLIRPSRSFLCYLPIKDSPAVGRLPALKAGHITFGSFNNFVKVVPEVITLWARILKAVPNSRMMLKTDSFCDRTTRQYAIDMFVQRGIEAGRIALLSSEPSPKHLESYNFVDIGMDTFPFNGGATTCEAMWMGVPVITLAGSAYHSRVGISLLSNVGLKDLVARTCEEYVDIAVNLAGDLKRLQSLREGLRDMMAQSPLTDAKKFTLELENCYRAIWVEWCKKNGALV